MNYFLFYHREFFYDINYFNFITIKILMIVEFDNLSEVIHDRRKFFNYELISYFQRRSNRQIWKCTDWNISEWIFQKFHRRWVISYNIWMGKISISSKRPTCTISSKIYEIILYLCTLLLFKMRIQVCLCVKVFQKK